MALALRTEFEELDRLTRLAKVYPDWVHLEQLATATARGKTIPILGLVMGSRDRSKPTLGIFAGSHGLERIGSQVVLSALENWAERLTWDSDLQKLFQEVRVVSIPTINPGGIFFGTRCNPRGIDLMRNAPVEPTERVTWLVGGHRISPLLPWYRGKKNDPMEIEAQALVDFVKREMFQARASLSLDVHSGFGLKDRLWHPYGDSARAFPLLPQMQRLEDLFTRAYPYHIYQVEQQSKAYRIAGDLWDFLFEESLRCVTPLTYIPLTIEMGSWIWLKKNPFQAFSKAGFFHPIKIHRYERVMRRHLLLFDFLLRVTKHPHLWTNP